MRFTVKFDSTFCSLQDQQIAVNYPTQKSSVFSYTLSRNFDLQQHIHNIHKSLKTIGVPIVDSSNNFSLQVRTISGDHLIPEEVPLYLKACDPLELQLLRISDICKKNKIKGLILNFVISPEIRAERAIRLLQNSNSDALKNVVFVLRTQFEDFRFSYKFIESNGFQTLLRIIDTTKGNTLSYCISAVAHAIQTEENLNSFLKIDEGVPKIYEKVKNPLISVRKSALEVLRTCTTVVDGWNRVHDYSTQNDNNYETLLDVLESEDLRTRLDALHLLNNLLQYAERVGSDKKELVLNLLKEKDVETILKNSAWIKHTDIVNQLALFENLTGIPLGLQHSSSEPNNNSNSLMSSSNNNNMNRDTPSSKELEMTQRIQELEVQLAFYQSNQAMNTSLSDTLDLDDEENALKRISKENIVSDDPDKNRYLDEIENLKELIKNLQKQKIEVIEEKDKQFIQLQGEIQTLNDIVTELEAHNQQLIELQCEQLAANNNNDNDEEKKVVKIDDSKDNEANNSNNNNSNNNEEYKKINLELEEKVNKLIEEKNRLEKELEEANLSLNSQKSEISSMIEKKGTMQHLIANLDTKNRSLSEEISQLKGQIANNDSSELKYRGSLKLSASQDDNESSDVLREKLLRMEKLVMLTMNQKQEMKKEIDRLTALVNQQNSS